MIFDPFKGLLVTKKKDEKTYHDITNPPDFINSPANKRMSGKTTNQIIQEAEEVLKECEEALAYLDSKKKKQGRA